MLLHVGFALDWVVVPPSPYKTYSINVHIIHTSLESGSTIYKNDAKIRPNLHKRKEAGLPDGMPRSLI
jgi:hypothetical protein